MKDVFAELVAYKISQKLGFPNIPETKIAKINDKIGSLQDFIAGDINYNEINSDDFKNQLDKLKIFSFVFGQWDLSTYNFVVTCDDNL